VDRVATIGHDAAMTGKAPIVGLFLLLLGEPATAADHPAGRYRLIGEQDVASELVLADNGHFQYFLTAGALDEHAEGRWRREGGKLHLTTEPRPVPPSFAQGPASRSAEAALSVKVSWPDGRGIAGIDFRIGFDAGEPVTSYTQEEGWTLTADEKRVPRWIELALPMYGLASPRFPIDLAGGNMLSFILTPNDLGKVDFGDLAIEMDGPNLVVHRFGQRLIYARQKKRDR
jgi:hypothetical protein